MQRISLRSSVATLAVLLIAFTNFNSAHAQNAQAAAAAAQQAEEEARSQQLLQQRAADEQLQQLQELNAQRGRRAGTRGGRGGVGGLGGTTSDLFGGEPAASTFAQRGRGGRNTGFSDAAQPVPDTADPNASPDLITIDLWVLSINMNRDKAADDAVAGLVAKVNNLPPVLNSTNDVKELVGKLVVAGVLKRSREYRLVAVNGQSAMLQNGASEPQVMASQNMRGGGGRGIQNQIQYQSIGTMIQATPRIDAAGNIQVSLSYEASNVEKTDPAVVIAESEDGILTTASRTVTQHVTSNVRLKKGSAIVVQKEISAEPAEIGGGAVRTHLMILGASVIPALD